MTKKRSSIVKAAARAHTDLNIFYGIIALLEGVWSVLKPMPTPIAS